MAHSATTISNYLLVFFLGFWPVSLFP
jgi:hypothetical protein